MSDGTVGSSASAVSVVVPTAARSDDPVVAVRTMLETDSDLIVEVIVVSDARADGEVLDAIAGLDARVRHVRGWEPFNFSERVNLGVACSSGAAVLLANDDTEFTRAGWLREMYALLATDTGDPQVVGAVLAYDDLTTQHAGQVFAGYYPGHRGGGAALSAEGATPFDTPSECSAVTGALLLVERSTWERVGGFSSSLPVNYNDTDFCLKVRRDGGRCVVAPWAGIIHHESRTRSATVATGEIEQLWSRWWPQLGVEEFHPAEAARLVDAMRSGSDKENR